MALRTIARMYDNYDDAKAIVQDLEGAGIPHNEISLVANAAAHGRSAELGAADAETAPSSGGKLGAVAGTVLGGGVGLLAGIGALAIPGVGPVVAAGWLVATLTGAGIGAASGGLVGALTGAGVSADEAHVYVEEVKRGGSLVTVRADEHEATRTEAIMARRGSADWQQRRAFYGNDWKGFDPSTSSTAYSGDTPASTGAPLSNGERTYVPGTDPVRPL